MKTSLLILLLSLFASVAQATTHSVTTCDSSHIQSAFNAATESGADVYLNCATGSMTARMTWSAPANAILRGNGSTSIDGGNNQTVLIDNDTRNEALFDISTNASGTFRMYGITLRGGSGVLKDQGVFKIGGAGAKTRIDHITFDGSTYNPLNNGKWMQVGGGVRGVLDHSILTLVGLSWTHFTNGGDFAGDATWAEDTGFGTSNFFFIEDNQITSYSVGSTVYLGTLTDCQSGGRFVVRFNTLVATAIGQTHPTGHSGDDRGCRAHENYGNLVTSPLLIDPNFAMDYNNSGPAMVWNNQALNVYKNIIYFNDCRQDTGCGYKQNDTPAGWGWCGTAHGGPGSSWDRNDSVPRGQPCIDQPGRGKGDLLTGSFPKKIDKATGTIHWPNQALEPEYIWMNNASIVAGWGGNYIANVSNGRVVSDVDYYAQASGIQRNATTPFNGTTGTGWGTLANRPTTCTTSTETGGGVGYFATDQGSWNTSKSNDHGVQMNGANGVLYRCSATNTWTPYYTPYQYPHPLVNSAGASGPAGQGR